ncbi:hypothetical protein cyc_06659 [Cyclospora cayetanensis]|uniref:Uncharacterized protein n=1 Tax=Cyclospora cayetanensis TaxID=88456 RepID=A0A1D3CRR2_9EIME|nr:hypothetical protein cyc_06659 [Cyclospora cayetanensis]
MVVGQLRVAPASGRNALIGIGNDVDQFQMGIDSSGSFIIASPRSTILSVDDEDTMHIHANLSTSSLDLQGPLTVRGVPQFRTTHREDFTSGSAEGWDNPGLLLIVTQGRMGVSHTHGLNDYQPLMNAHMNSSFKGPVGEGKFSTPIEVVVPHDKDSVTVSFGSTVRQYHTAYWYQVLKSRNQIETDDPFDQSWGVSRCIQ